MEGLRKISLLLILVATLHLSAAHLMMDSRTGLNIPEKILGVIDIVQNHKKPGQAPQNQQFLGQNQQFQGQNQQYQPQNYPQYWNQGQAQYQGQFQGQQGQQQAQIQGQNQGQYYPPAQGTYPQNNVPVYQPQPTYPQYPVQNGQNQAQGQFQYQNGGQFQGQNQNQQGNGQYQGQVQQGFQNGHNQYPNQAGQFQGQQGTGQYGQESQFQAVQSTGSQTSGFQVTGGHTGSQGPACVCQAWTKPNATKGEAPPLEKTDVDLNEVPVRM